MNYEKPQQSKKIQMKTRHKTEKAGAPLLHKFCYRLILAFLVLGIGLPTLPILAEPEDAPGSSPENPVVVTAGPLSTQETAWALSNRGLTPSSEYPFSMDVAPTMPNLSSGIIGGLAFTLTNISDYQLAVREVVLEASGESFPFESYSTRIKAQLKGGSYDEVYDTGYEVVDGDDFSLNYNNKLFVFFPPMKVKDNIQDGYYELNFTVRFYADQDRDLKEQNISYSIKLQGDPANKKDQRVLISAAPLATQLGSYGAAMNLQLGLINRGFDPVDIISVTPQVSAEADAWPFEIAQMDYSKAVGASLRPLALGAENGNVSDGTLLLLDFGQVIVREDISSGYKKVDFLVKHKYGNQPIEETTISIYIDIAGNPVKDAENQPDSGKEWPQSKPRLMCTGFTTSPAKVEGGKNFTLSLCIQNTSTLSAVQNIRIELGSDPVGENGVPPFLTESGASSVYVPYIGPEEEHVLEILMTASSQVPQKIYPLHVSMEYEDWQASPISAKESISIQLSQEVRVDHGKFEIMPQELSVGQEANLMFPLYNKGKTTLYNVTATIPTDQGLSAAESFLGNINPGATAQVDMMVKAEAPFTMEESKTLQITYEDENGNKATKDFEFNMSVMDDSMMDMPGGMPPMDDPDGMDPDGMDPLMGEMGSESGMLAIMPLWAWILTGILLLIFIILLISQIRKKRHKKRMRLEDEAYFKDLMS